MSTRKLIGKVSATEKNPSSCDEFQFWMSDDTILSPFDIVLVQNKTDDSITYGVVQDTYTHTVSKRTSSMRIPHCQLKI